MACMMGMMGSQGSYDCCRIHRSGIGSSFSIAGDEMLGDEMLGDEMLGDEMMGVGGWPARVMGRFMTPPYLPIFRLVRA